MATHLGESDLRACKLRAELARLRTDLQERGLLAMYTHLFDALEPAQELCWGNDDLQQVIAKAQTAKDCHDRLMEAIGWMGAA